MGRFMIEGLVTSEPTEMTVSSGKVIKKLCVEESVTTSKGQLVTYNHEIEFFGLFADRLPKIALTGCRVFVMGSVTSKNYGGRSYRDLFGEQLMVITGPNYEQAQPGRPDEPNEDDLPF